MAGHSRTTRWPGGPAAARDPAPNRLARDRETAARRIFVFRDGAHGSAAQPGRPRPGPTAIHRRQNRRVVARPPRPAASPRIGGSGLVMRAQRQLDARSSDPAGDKLPVAPVQAAPSWSQRIAAVTIDPRRRKSPGPTGCPGLPLGGFAAVGARRKAMFRQTSDAFAVISLGISASFCPFRLPCGCRAMFRSNKVHPPTVCIRNAAKRVQSRGPIHEAGHVKFRPAARIVVARTTSTRL